jgi:hypothetical protein
MNKHFKDIKATVSVTDWRLEQLRRDGFNAATLTSYLHDNAVRVLNGHRADQGITVDLSEHHAHKARTDSDIKGRGDARAGDSFLGSAEPRPVADSAAPRLTESEKAEAVDAGARSLARAVVGEWPKYRKMLNGVGVYAGREDGCMYHQHEGRLRGPYARFESDRGSPEITPAEAADWLERNGHPDAAKQARGDDPLRDDASLRKHLGAK